MGECFPLAFNESRADCPAGDVFFGSIDTTSSVEDPNYVAIKIKRILLQWTQKMMVKCASTTRRTWKIQLVILVMNVHTYIGKGM